MLNRTRLPVLLDTLVLPALCVVHPGSHQVALSRPAGPQCQYQGARSGVREATKACESCHLKARVPPTIISGSHVSLPEGRRPGKGKIISQPSRDRGKSSTKQSGLCLTTRDPPISRKCDGQHFPPVLIPLAALFETLVWPWRAGVRSVSFIQTTSTSHHKLVAVG